MKPKVVMVVRHAERPLRGVSGVDPKGNQDKHCLVPRGWQRAGALAVLFSDPPEPLLRPDHIFAASDARASDSKRPMQTVTPLASKLGLTIESGFGKGHERDMVATLMARKGAVVIAWQHEAIPKIARLIAGRGTYPKWSASTYDMIWVFTRHHNHYRFSIVPQRVLAGDSLKPKG